jgi:hypothetical protein
MSRFSINIYSTFTGNSQTFFLEGERNVGLYLLRMRGLADTAGLENLKKKKEVKKDG